MVRGPFLLLLNESFKEDLLSLPAADKKRLGEKLEFLANGMWDAGVRVKKLHLPSPHVVFEARLNRADRMLFTLGREGGRPAVYVWGIHHHDDVSAASRRTARAENAAFLLLETDDGEELPELVIDELPDAYMTQEPIAEKARADYGPQKWLVADGDELERLLRSNADDGMELLLYVTEEQQSILNQHPPLLLSGTAGSGKTTISVYYLLVSDVSGRKLFVTYNRYLRDLSRRIYNGLMKNRRSSGADAPEDKIPPEFRTLREMLEQVCDAAGTLPPAHLEVGFAEFTEIFAHHRLARSYDAELVWEEIRSIVKGATPALSPRRLSTLAARYADRTLRPREVEELCGYLLSVKRLKLAHKIERVRERKTTLASYEDFVQALRERRRGSDDAVRLLLDQTVRQIDSHGSAVQKPLLSFEEYELLGKKRAPTFRHDRRELYSIAEYYQQRLEDGGRWDEIDLTRTALLALAEHPDQLGYDLVVCDEVQDLTDLQLSFLFRLAKSPNELILTGDPKQIINPSGFRWEEVRNKFYELGIAVPEVFGLNLNFRCVGSIVRLANALLDLKQRTVGLSGSEMREDWKFNGRPAFLIHGVRRKDLLSEITLSGAGRVLLTRTEAQRDELKRRLGTEMVFTIYEAKGLEFDTVLLWCFAETGRVSGLWRRLRRGDVTEESHAAHVRHEINLLYVAVTRARNTLIIYDGAQCSDVWLVDEIAPHVYASDELSALREAWRRVSTPDEWAHQGDYFFEREYYKHAAECYKNAGSLQRQQLSTAKHHMSEGRYGDAAPILEELGDSIAAAECYERTASLLKAAELWRGAGEQRRAEVCEASHLERTGRWGEAAERWEQLGDYERAGEAWAKGGNLSRAAELAAERGDMAAAAELFEQAEDFGKAAACRLQLNQRDRAASLFLRAGDYESALPLAKRAGDRANELLCCLKLGSYYDAGLLCEKEKNIEKAEECFRRFVETGSEARAALLSEAQQSKLPRWKAGLRFAALDMHVRAAECYTASRKPREAAAAYIRAGQHRSAAELLASGGRFKEAAEVVESAPEPDYELVHEYLGRYVVPQGRYGYSQITLERDQELRREVDLLTSQGKLDSALARAKALGDDELVDKLYRKSGRGSEALGHFLTSGDFLSSSRYMDRISDCDVDAALVEKTIDAYKKRGGLYMYDGDTVLAIKIISAVILRAVDLHGAAAIKPLCESWLSSIRWYWRYGGRVVPRQYEDLVVKLRHYEALVRLLRSHRPLQGDAYTEEALDFAARVQEIGQDQNDENLIACAAMIFFPDEKDGILAEEPCTVSNAILFADGPRYKEAVDVALEAGRFDLALDISHFSGDAHRSAELHALKGDAKSAIRIYLDNGYAEDALELALREDDEVGQARAYERLGRFAEALEIWKRRGNKRDSQRIQKKIDDPRQGELF